MPAAAGTSALTSTLRAACAPAAHAAHAAPTGGTPATAAEGTPGGHGHGHGHGRTRLVRGTILHYLKDPGETPDPRAWELFETVYSPSTAPEKWRGPATSPACRGDCGTGRSGSTTAES